MRAITLPRAALRLGATAMTLSALLLPSSADVRYLYASLDGAQNVPPVTTPASGEGIFVLDTTQSTLGFEITYQDIPSFETFSHIHGPAAPGQNGPIMFGIPGGTPKIGTLTLTAVQMGHVDGGLTYTNIHTGDEPDGELRGQNLVTSRGYCFGDGSGTACPCGNNGGAHTGCANTSGVGGRLRPAGFPTANGSQLRFIADGLIPGSPALLFVGDNAVNSGAGASFGDGLRCAGVNVVRLGILAPDAAGRAEWGPGLDVAGGWSTGDTRRFQTWYRDPTGGGACGNGFNLTNGVEVVMQ